MSEKGKTLYTRYPASSIWLYNGTTVFHFLLGTAGILIGFHGPAAVIVGAVYFLFAFLEMYLLMPLKVCPNCVYYRLDGAVCISGLNVLSRKIAGAGDVKCFGARARGLLCPNNLYLASLMLPVPILIIALILNFSVVVLIILLAVFGLMAFRFFVLFTKVACVHCRAINVCPNAKSMGLSEK